MSTDARLTTLEQAMAELALAQARLSASLDRTNATVDRTSATVDRTSANLDRLADEMRAFKEESRADREAARAQMDAFQVEMRAFKDEMSRNHAEMRQRYGELSMSLGTLAEDIVAPSIPDVFKTVFGVEPTGQSVRSSFKHREDPGQSQEFDVVAWGGGYFLVNETRKRARPEDITALLELLPKARQYFPQAEAMKVVGSLASFYLDPSLVRGAERQGLLVFGLGGGLLEILNSPGFRPRGF